MQQDSYKTTAYPKFGSFPVTNTPNGSKLSDAAGFFDNLMSIVQKSAVTPELGHIACGQLISAWGTVNYALGAKTNG